MIAPVSRASDRICASCGGQAVGYGIVAKYTPRGKDPLIYWCCGHPDCFIVTQDTYTMPDFEFKRLELLATEQGGQEAGAYLDELDKTDLASLSEQEWAEFCRRLVAGYRHALHVTLRDSAPF